MTESGALTFALMRKRTRKTFRIREHYEDFLCVIPRCTTCPIGYWDIHCFVTRDSLGNIVSCCTTTPHMNTLNGPITVRVI